MLCRVVQLWEGPSEKHTGLDRTIRFVETGAGPAQEKVRQGIGRADSIPSSLRSAMVVRLLS